MAHAWQLQDAKNKLSEVINEAIAHGPQIITRRGKETAVILSVDEYRHMAQPKTGLVKFMQQSPLRGVKLDLTRNTDPGRDTAL